MIKAVFYLTYAIVLNKTMSLEKICSFIQKRKSKCKENWTKEDAERAVKQIESVKSLFFSRTACLERSLALCLWATAQKKNVNWIIGARLAPFMSHAWIEIEGIPIKESEDLSKLQKIVVI